MDFPMSYMGFSCIFSLNQTIEVQYHIKWRLWNFEQSRWHAFTKHGILNFELVYYGVLFVAACIIYEYL